MKYPAWVYYVGLIGSPRSYIGLSHDPEKRFAQHQSALRAGRHPVEDFQADYDASEIKKPYFLRLEKVGSETERFKEHEWQLRFRTYDREHGYNYKDPTARTETEKAEKKKRCKTFLRERTRKAFMLVAQKPPRSKKQAQHEEWEKLQALTDEEFVAMYI